MGCGLGNNRMATKIPGPHSPRLFLMGSSEFIRLPYPSTCQWNLKKKKNPCCYYRCDPSGFRTCAMQSAASYQPLRATGGASPLTFASPVPVAMRSRIRDTRCSIRKTHRFLIAVFHCISVTFTQSLTILQKLLCQAQAAYLSSPPRMQSINKNIN